MLYGFKFLVQRSDAYFPVALPTIKSAEDDMTIDLDVKIPYLKTFHEIIYQKGWNFTKSKSVQHWTLGVTV